MSDTRPDIAQELAAFLRESSGADDVTVLDFQRLSGGAIQSNYGFTVRCRGGELDGHQELVVRSDSPSQVSVSLSREQEFNLLQVAWQAGVTVPRPWYLCTDTTRIGVPFYIMQRVGGTANGRVLARGGVSDADSPLITRQLGQELARLHAVQPPHPLLGFLPLPQGPVALARVHEYRQALSHIPEPHPVLEYALNWLEDNAPAPADVVLCHGDFRTGNYMVEGNRVTGVLDWEFAAWSDPHEDLGWLCARSWRFGNNAREVGGVGHKADLFPAYTEASGRAVDPAAVLYFEAMAMVRWAVIALQQAQRHISGQEPSLELALTGRMVPEMEYDLLNHIQHLEA